MTDDALGEVRMARAKTYLGNLALFTFGGLIVGVSLAVCAAPVAGIVGWVEGDAPGIVMGSLIGVGALVGLVWGIVYETPSARAERERPRTPLELRLARDRQRWQAERTTQRRARRRQLSDDASMVVLAVLGSLAMLAFVVSGVLGVVQLLGFDDPRHVPYGIALGLVVGAPLVWLGWRMLRGGGGGGGGWSSGDDFFDGGGDY
jgi:hypothetical protein